MDEPVLFFGLPAVHYAVDLDSLDIPPICGARDIESRTNDPAYVDCPDCLAAL